MTSLRWSSLRPCTFSSTVSMRLLPRRLSTTAQHHLAGDVQAIDGRRTSSPAEASRLSSTTGSKPIEPSSATSSPHLPYHVHRTASQELPIYHLAKRGGNLLQTRIRKIQGDITKLRDELQVALKLKKEHAVINQVTRHILLKGWHKDEVKRFLQVRNF